MFWVRDVQAVVPSPIEVLGCAPFLVREGYSYAVILKYR